MNTCTICGCDGVLQVQTAWYCRDHAVDGALGAIQLIATWARPGAVQGVLDRTAWALEVNGIPSNRPARYICPNCDDEYWTSDDCINCGEEVDLKEEE